MRFFYTIFVLSLLISCGSPNKKSMQVTGKIDGLRKGTLYLQKLQDSTIINIDSFKIQKNSDFRLETEIESPEIYYLYLAKEDGDTLNDRILFFAEKGEIVINSLLKTFESSAQISGSENQVLFEEYQSVLKKFNEQNLNLIKDYIKDDGLTASEKEQKLTKASKSLLRRRYLYALNYANNNADKEIAAYIGLFEVNDANKKFLDDLYNKMSKKVKNSVYGLAFGKYLSSLKEEEKVEKAE